MAVPVREKPVVDLTPIYARVLATREEPLWDAGNIRACMLLALGEMYSPTYDAILYESGFVLPLPDFEDRLPVNTLVRFLAAIESAWTDRPKLMRISNLMVINGWERTTVLDLMDEAEGMFHPIPEIRWQQGFRFYRFVQQEHDQQLARQIRKRDEQAKEKSRGVTSINRFLSSNKSFALRSESLSPTTYTTNKK